MYVVAVVHARMGSSRLPGKALAPLDGTPSVRHVITRTRAASAVDDVVMATTERQQDDVIARQGELAGVSVHRGPENDLLGRIYGAVSDTDADVLIRVCGDSPLLSPAVVDSAVRIARETGADFVSDTVGGRTLPGGLCVSALSRASFDILESTVTDPQHREHVTSFYRENPGEFDLRPLNARQIFDTPILYDRTELRLTLDYPADYELLRRLYTETGYDEILHAHDAVAYVDDHDLAEITAHIRDH